MTKKFLRPLDKISVAFDMLERFQAQSDRRRPPATEEMNALKQTKRKRCRLPVIIRGMTNLSKQKREVLEGKIELLRGKLDATDVEAQNALFALEAELKHKKYGLVWEEHEEEIDRTLSENLPVLTEQTELAVNAGGLTHFLLEGDNLAALQILKRTHKGKIDVIYIDPPYNTGSDQFTYEDSIVDSNDGFKHSKWISFINERLKAAKELLTIDGLIMISINEIELYSLKLLCDEIFGEQNFLAKFIWQSTPGSNTGLDIKTITEYVLCYAKNKLDCKVGAIPIECDETRYSEEDEHVARRGRYTLNKLDRRMTGHHYSDALNYQITMPDGVALYPGGTEEKQSHWNWRWSESKVKWGLENDFIVFKKTRGRWSVYFKQYFKVNNEDKKIVRSLPFQNLIKDLEGANSARGTQETMEVFEARKFDYPKPLNLIKYLLTVHSDKNATVLDFFAGSGTTGQAVLELNEEDGGSRQFILCTNNENDICRNITYERMKTVITGKRHDGSAYSDGIAATLKYDKIDYVAVKEDGDILLYDDYADELLAHVREMVELENGISFESDSTIKICLYEDELDEFVDALDEKSEVRAVYVGHDLLMTAQQKAKLAALNVAVNIIPQYYYEDEV